MWPIAIYLLIVSFYSTIILYFFGLSFFSSLIIKKARNKINQKSRIILLALLAYFVSLRIFLYFLRGSTTPAKVDRALSAVFRKFTKIILTAFLDGGMGLSCFGEGCLDDLYFFELILGNLLI
jgi:hypothetical protein